MEFNKKIFELYLMRYMRHEEVSIHIGNVFLAPSLLIACITMVLVVECVVHEVNIVPLVCVCSP